MASEPNADNEPVCTACGKGIPDGEGHFHVAGESFHVDCYKNRRRTFDPRRR